MTENKEDTVLVNFDKLFKELKQDLNGVYCLRFSGHHTSKFYSLSISKYYFKYITHKIVYLSLIRYNFPNFI